MENQRLRTLNTSNFQDEVLDNDIPVLVCFSSKNCGPCQQVIPRLELLAAEYKDRMDFGVLKSTDGPQIFIKHSVRSVPTILFFNDGGVVKRVNGLQNEIELRRAIEDVLRWHRS
jgi:thioredoxin 1